ncbi:hypothetical protein M501DRAFT_996774 [Patellaria atrata CBS 101060]|uniref:Histone deacetylase interacting domain-containing protein n=1 Tax=Patellaria atrata CBS 101060 TaxID=1346257 RepID=A0A9P4S7P8_9PEZI|nr:hypothetical protein M501DRAFT_996774 [Patellaria atrata CBS 101060]
MNSTSRDGWPPSQGTGANLTNGPPVGEQSLAQGPRALGFSATPHTQQHPQQPAAPGGSHVLPPPSGPFFSPQQPGHLPSLPTLSQPSQTSPRQSSQRPTSATHESLSAAQQHQVGHQSGAFSLPTINQALHSQNLAQPHPTADRDRSHREVPADIRDTHLEEAASREAEQREREMRQMRDRQQLEQPTHENNVSATHLHQPQAVGPQIRAMHGPNGLLGNSGSIGGSTLSASLGAPSGPGNIFVANNNQQNDSGNRVQQQASQQAQHSLLMPFGGATAVPSAPLGMGQGQQPILNDALSYLDQVKVQFADHPDVYNKFLDIMKDFKSGAIDTPGVIERVSNLFAGHPNLIQGFNTFLPPGYKIECGTSDDPNAIRVTTPMGTTVSSMPVPRALSPRGAPVNGNAGPDRTFYEGARAPAWSQTPGTAAQDVIFSPGNRIPQPSFGTQNNQPAPAPLSPETQRDHQIVAALTHQQEQRGVSQLQNAASAVGGARPGFLSPPSGSNLPLPPQSLNGIPPLGPQTAGSAAEKRGPVEFNHAISYVNKIKNRFAQQPDIYKQFLEILQTYQRESKPIQDVYAQVTQLFNAAPDLLEDFKQFLPESAAQAKAAAARQAAEDQAPTSNVRGELSYAAAQQQVQQTPRPEQQPRMPPVGQFGPGHTSNRDGKRKRNDRLVITPAVVTPDSGSVAARAGYGPGNSLNKRVKQHGAKQASASDAPTVSPTLIPALPEPLPPTTTLLASQEDLAFFDRVKKFINNKGMMNEFLKLCNLYSNDIIDRATLFYRAQHYFGGNADLMTSFRTFIKYESKEEIIENRARPMSETVALNKCRGHGPSYRLLPKRERLKVCSGRDELCQEVLNDDWASHPTWASEDSGFVAHRKNVHEESLHRIEEERHDYDFNIEACQRTIQLLEPIAQTLRLGSNDERQSFVLHPGLGGQSETIYKRVIVKLYGRDRAREVITRLFAQPWSVIPVLLSRMKQKLEEWKAAQREWEKIWREQTQKVFWKSLDHQSAGTRAGDRKQFQSKTLLSEISVRAEEQRRQRYVQNLPVKRYQFAYTIDDIDVLFDVAHLVLVYAEQSTNTTDYPKLLEFLKTFIPLFFGIDRDGFEVRLAEEVENSSPPEDAEIENAASDEGPSSRTLKSNGKRPHDLLRDVLDRGRNKRPRREKDDSVASETRGSTPEISSAIDEEITGDVSSPTGSGSNPDPPSNRWLDYPDSGNIANKPEIAPNEPYKRHTYNMYANVQIYCFFRMFVMLYERLLNLKKSEPDVHKVIRRAKDAKPGHQMKIIDKTPDDFFGNTGPDANYYKQILGLFHEHINGHVDNEQVQETLRRFYLHVGFHLNSVSHLVSALARFALGIHSDDPKDKTKDIYNLFKKDRVREVTTHQDEITYRKQVEKFIKEGECFRITFDQHDMAVFIRIFKKDDMTFDTSTLDAERRWSYYITSWCLLDPTEGIVYDKLNMPILQHTALRPDDEDVSNVDNKEKLIIRVATENFKTFFESNTEEYSVSLKPESAIMVGDKEEMRSEHRNRRKSAQERLSMNNTWMKDLSKDDVDHQKHIFTEAVKSAEEDQVEDEEEAEIIATESN